MIHIKFCGIYSYQNDVTIFFLKYQYLIYNMPDFITFEGKNIIFQTSFIRNVSKKCLKTSVLKNKIQEL